MYVSIAFNDRNSWSYNNNNNNEDCFKFCTTCILSYKYRPKDLNCRNYVARSIASLPEISLSRIRALWIERVEGGGEEETERGRQTPEIDVTKCTKIVKQNGINLVGCSDNWDYYNTCTQRILIFRNSANKLIFETKYKYFLTWWQMKII